MLTKEFLEEKYYKEYKTQKEIADLTGYKQWQIAEAMKKFGLQARPTGKIVNLVGKKFGRLTVIEPVFRRNTKKEFRWKCQCDCGNIVDIKRGSLVYNKTKSCGCLKEELTGNSHHAWKGFGNIPGGFMSKYKNHAKRRGILFDLSLSYLDNLFQHQNGRCALTGKLLSFENYGYKNYANASLDRIDSNKAYIEGNVQWVDKDINFMKQSISQESFIKLCQSVVEFQIEKEKNTLMQ